VPLLSLSNYYAVSPLVDEIGDVLSYQINERNLSFLVNLCEMYQCETLNLGCAAYLAWHFDTLLREDKLLGLGVNTWVTMLKRDDLASTSEKAVFKAVLRYCEQYPEDKRKEALELLLPCVRFPLLSGDFLARWVDRKDMIKDVPILHDLLHEAYRFKVYPESVTSFRAQKRKSRFLEEEAMMERVRDDGWNLDYL